MTALNHVQGQDRPPTSLRFELVELYEQVLSVAPALQIGPRGQMGCNNTAVLVGMHRHWSEPSAGISSWAYSLEQL